MQEKLWPLDLDRKAMGQRVREHRELLGLTRADLASRCMISPTRLARIERGTLSSVSQGDVAGLARALEVPGRWLVDGLHPGRELGWHAYLLNVDIVGFSKVPEWVQIAMVRHLVNSLMKQPVMRNRVANRDYHLNSTGDGFILAIPSSGETLLPVDFCHSALRLVRACTEFSAAPFPLEVRAGIHVGELVVDKCLHPGLAFGIGVGLNWCTRVATAAGPGQVLLSEKFVQLLHQRLGPDATNALVYPEVPNDPFEIDVKHGSIAGVRLMKGSAEAKQGQVGSPLALLENSLIDSHLRLALQFLGNSVVVAVQEVHPKLTVEALSPRLTLWRRRDDYVQALQIRVQLPEAADDDLPPKSQTRYRLFQKSRNPPEGPVARAWVEKTAQAMLDVPDRDLDPDGYDARMTREGIPLDTAADFSRHARTWLCVPLLLLQEPTGVLCIDLMHPIDPPEIAEKLMERITVRSSYYLAALVHIRTT